METTQEISSRDARTAIFACHDELRGLVTETMRSAESAVAMGGEPGFDPLRVRARELYQAFEHHMDFEEGILEAALRDVIGLGPVLQAEVVEGHGKRRATLESAMSVLESTDLPRERLIEDVRAVVDALLSDLRAEERFLFTADLDALAVDTHGG